MGRNNKRTENKKINISYYWKTICTTKSYQDHTTNRQHMIYVRTSTIILVLEQINFLNLVSELLLDRIQIPSSESTS